LLIFLWSVEQLRPFFHHHVKMLLLWSNTGSIPNRAVRSPNFETCTLTSKRNANGLKIENKYQQA
jgi:hypothetical protein